MMRCLMLYLTAHIIFTVYNVWIRKGTYMNRCTSPIHNIITNSAGIIKSFKFKWNSADTKHTTYKPHKNITYKPHKNKKPTNQHKNLQSNPKTYNLQTNTKIQPTNHIKTNNLQNKQPTIKNKNIQPTNQQVRIYW